MSSLVQFAAVGRRKTSVARVYLRSGSGKIAVNKRTMENYFPLAWRRKQILKPLEITEHSG